MIKIKSFGSGSNGNCALVYNEDTKLLVDCGINYERLIKGLRMNKTLITNIKAVLFTHHHSDHLGCIKQLNEFEIPLYCTKQMTREYFIKGKEFIKNKPLKIGSIDIIPISVSHGNAECYAFILHDKESMIFFATDFLTINSNISSFPFTEIYIETNYINEYMERMIKDNDENIMKLTRQISTHTSLENSIEWLKQMNLSKCKKIVGIHLSNDLSNINIIKNKIYETFNIPSYCFNWKGEEV